MTNTTTIKTGKSQFNAKEAKNFRSVMAKYYDARHALNDETLLRNNRIKSLKSVIDVDSAQIAKIESGETVTGRTLEEIQTEISEFNSKIKTEKSNFETLATAQKKRLMDAEELATTALYNAYKEATLTDEKLPDYINGIADFFIGYINLADCIFCSNDNVDYFIRIRKKIIHSTVLQYGYRLVYCIRCCICIHHCRCRTCKSSCKNKCA